MEADVILQKLVEDPNVASNLAQYIESTSSGTLQYSKMMLENRSLQRSKRSHGRCLPSNAAILRTQICIDLVQCLVC